MKRTLLVILASALVGSTAASAATLYLPWTKNIYNVSYDNDSSNATVSVFDDRENKCYVVLHNSWKAQSDDDSVAISCVKR